MTDDLATEFAALEEELLVNAIRSDAFTYYILVDKQPVMVNDVLAWGRWLETGNRIISQTSCCCGQVWVSTVFLGLPQGDLPGLDRAPLLFETMIFGGIYDQDMTRYRSYDEAYTHHHVEVNRVSAVPVWRHVLANVRKDLAEWWSECRDELRSWWPWPPDDPYLIALRETTRGLRRIKLRDGASTPPQRAK